MTQSTTYPDRRTQTLRDRLRALGRPAVAPLMGYPGVRLAGATIRESLFRPDCHFRTVESLADRFAPDVQHFLMDLSLEAAGLGVGVDYPEMDRARVIEQPVVGCEDVERLAEVDLLDSSRVQAFLETMNAMDAGLDGLLGGYVVGPFTLASLLCRRNLTALSAGDDPEELRPLMSLTTATARTYADALVAAGADVITVLEPRAVSLSPAAFRRFVSPYLTALINHLDAHTVLHICGDASPLIEAMVQTGAEGLSVDGPVDVLDTVRRVPADCVVFGNIQPLAVAQGTPETVRSATRALLEQMAAYPNFVLSSGCDLPPHTPLANIEAMVDTVREGL